MNNFRDYQSKVMGPGNKNPLIQSKNKSSVQFTKLTRQHPNQLGVKEKRNADDFPEETTKKTRNQSNSSLVRKYASVPKSRQVPQIHSTPIIPVESFH